MRALIASALPAIVLGLATTAGDLKSQDSGKVQNDRRKQAEKELAEIEKRVENEPWAVRSRAAVSAVLLEVARADKVELFRLNPKPVGDGGTKLSFHGYEIIGETVEPFGKDRKHLREFLTKSLHWDTVYRQGPHFAPRHGLRITAGKKTLDLVISFECNRVKVFDGTEERAILALAYVESNVIDTLLSQMGPVPNERPSP
jgi:hypothetical protein